MVQLGAPLLIGRDCPIFPQLVRQKEMRRATETRPAPVTAASAQAKLPLPIRPGELAHLTRIDPSLENARQAADEPNNPAYTGPQFEWEHSLLYRVIGEKRQLVVLIALQPRLLFLAHEVALSRTLSHGENISPIHTEALLARHPRPGIQTLFILSRVSIGTT